MNALEYQKAARSRVDELRHDVTTHRFTANTVAMICRHCDRVLVLGTHEPGGEVFDTRGDLLDEPCSAWRESRGRPVAAQRF